MAKIERNASCPCGSGKKYKRCCGQEHGLAALPAFGKAESERAIAFLMQMTHSEMFAGARAAAEVEFFEDALESASRDQIQAALDHEQTQIAFNMWTMFDAYITEDRHRLMEVVLNGSIRTQFTRGQLRFLERMAQSHMRPYEVREVRLDEGFVLLDLWSDEEAFVSERSATHYVQRGETFFARAIEGSRGAIELHGAVLTLMPLAMQELVQSLRASFRGKRRKRSDLDDSCFFKEAGPRIAQAWLARFTWRLPKMIIGEGEALRSQDLIYDILDRDALDRALREVDDIEWNEGAGQYVWLGGPSHLGIGRSILGSLTPEGSRLRVHVMSNERAHRVRELLDRIASQALRYRLSEMQDFSRMQSEPPSSSKHANTEEVPPEIASQLLAEFSERYHRAWIDEEIPALGGRTPRHAAKLKTQRAKVAALLREIEMRPLGPRSEDIGWMWEELGLSDLR